MTCFGLFSTTLNFTATKKKFSKVEAKEKFNLRSLIKCNDGLIKNLKWLSLLKRMNTLLMLHPFSIKYKKNNAGIINPYSELSVANQVLEVWKSIEKVREY